MDLNWILTVIATIILHGSSIPQYIRNYKRKKTEDISITLWVMVLIGYILLLIIAFMTNNKYFIWVYIIGIVNLCGLIIQILYYRKWTKNK